MSTSAFQSHLSVLESSVRSYPTRPAFRTPVVDKETSQISEWATITYAQFYQDVQLYARYWTSILSADGVAPGSIIGLWYVSPLVLLISLHTLTLHSIQGSVAQHTPMCFTSTERPGLATSPKCSACASLTLSPSSSCCKIPAPAPWFANHHFTLTSRGAQSRTTQPYKSVTKMCRMLFYLHSGQTIPRLISRSSSIQADRQAVDLNWSHAIGDGSTISW